MVSVPSARGLGGANEDGIRTAAFAQYWGDTEALIFEYIELVLTVAKLWKQ